MAKKVNLNDLRLSEYGTGNWKLVLVNPHDPKNWHVVNVHTRKLLVVGPVGRQGAAFLRLAMQRVDALNRQDKGL